MKALGENYREYSSVDKSTWPDGPWQHEPDKLQWIDADTGLDCLIVRQSHSGHLCGYVGVPPSHPLYGVGYSEKANVLNEALSARMERPIGAFQFTRTIQALCGSVEASPESVFDVHGGLTFSAACRPGETEAQGICHVAAPGRPDPIRRQRSTEASHVAFVRRIRLSIPIAPSLATSA